MRIDLSTRSCLEIRMQEQITVWTLQNSSFERVEELSSRLLPKNLKIKIYRTTLLPFVLYGCEIWSLTLREKRGLSVFFRIGC